MDSPATRAAAEPLLAESDDVDYATRDVEAGGKGADDLRRRKGRSWPRRAVPPGVKQTKPQDFDGLDFEDGS